MNITGRKLLTLSLVFAACIYLLEEWMFLSHQGEYLRRTTAPGDDAQILMAILSSIMAFALFVYFVWTAITSSTEFRRFYAIVYVSITIIQTSFWAAVNRFFHPIDLSTAVNSSLGMWATSAQLYFSWSFLVPSLLFIVLLVYTWNIDQNQRRSLIKFGALLGALLAWSMLGSLARFDLNPGVSMFHFFQTGYEFIVETLTPRERALVTYRAAHQPENNIVLIIDESVRADHLSINGYERNTTPFLETLAHNHRQYHNWGTIASGGTCSLIANHLLLTGVPVQSKSYALTKTYPTLFQYAKAMGYQTTYLDAQTAFLWNGLQPNDLQWVDQYLNVNELSDTIKADFRAAERIREIVTTTTGNFIVLNKRGIHFLYQDAYPAKETVWQPVPINDETNPERVENAYDNAIRYNVDGFFTTLLKNIDPAHHQTVYVYTADHGQTLFEDGAAWLHCHHTHIEASVPLVIFGELGRMVDTSRPAAHSNVFSALLDLMGVPATARVFDYNPSLFSPTSMVPADRFYFDGALQPIPYDD